MGKASRRKDSRKKDFPILREQSSAPEPIQPDQVLVCDFCILERPKWGYATKDDPTEGGRSTEEDGANYGWAACDICHDLIERGRHDELAKRSATTFIQRFPELEKLPFKTVMAQMKMLHDGFRSVRVGPALTNKQYEEKYGRITTSHRRRGTHLGEFMKKEGLDILAGTTERPGESLGRTIPPGEEVLHHVIEGKESHYIPEGFTAEQLADPKTIDYLMKRIERDRPAPNIPLTTPPVVKHWVGARNFLQAVAAVYGENPRSDDLFEPEPAMMMARMILEPILQAHPVVLEPEQMNAIDDEDWSFAEAIDYGMMAHLPFEPLYLDFGGHESVMVDLDAGQAQLHGAVIWRSGFFKEPTLAIAPIGGFDYLTGQLSEKLIAEGFDKKKVLKYTGMRPGKDIKLGDEGPYGSVSQRKALGPTHRITSQEFQQWRYQPAGICWFGISTPGGGRLHEYETITQKILQDRGVHEVPMVFSTGKAIAQVLGEERLMEDPQYVRAQILTGMFDQQEPSEKQSDREWARLAYCATEMVAKLAERALLGLYFIENAPVTVDQVSLSRPERREMERETRKGRDPGEVASIVIIPSRRSDSSRTGEGDLGSVDYQYRWERRGYFMHLHENNRHYQNRPDKVKPCHKCAFEYAANERARRDGKDLPHPTTESDDCVKIWVHPTVCGPEEKPLKKKVRIKRADRKKAA